MRAARLACLLALAVMLAGCQITTGNVTVGAGASAAAPAADTLYQYSTIDALLEGVYDGQLTCGELLSHGGLGLGTFQNLDGEMVVLEGKVYQVRADGSVALMPAETLTPFAQVAQFQPEMTIKVPGTVNLDQLKQYLDQRLESLNLFYALSIQGRFNSIMARSVPPQKPPFPKLVEVVKHQSLFKFNSVRGTVVGFRGPAYIKGSGVPGYHLHFLNEKRDAGGHVLEMTVTDPVVRIDVLRRLDMQLPSRGGFLTTPLGGDRSRDLHQVER